jgi:hypothetical protein
MIPVLIWITLMGNGDRLLINPIYILEAYSVNEGEVSGSVIVMNNDRKFRIRETLDYIQSSIVTTTANINQEIDLCSKGGD